MVPVYTTKLLQNLEKISDSIRPKKVFARYSITVSDEYPASVTGYVYEKYKAKDYPSLQYLESQVFTATVKGFLKSGFRVC